MLHIYLNYFYSGNMCAFINLILFFVSVTVCFGQLEEPILILTLEPHNGPFVEGDHIKVSCNITSPWDHWLTGRNATLFYKNDISTRRNLTHFESGVGSGLVSDDWILSYEDDKNNITCIPHTRIYTRNVSRVISVQYRPIIYDDKGVRANGDIASSFEFLALGYKASIIVKVKANPKPTLVRWAAGNETIGDDDERIRKEEIDENDGFYTYKLTIANPNKCDVLKTYVFYVANMIGNAFVDIRLQPDPFYFSLLQTENMKCFEEIKEDPILTLTLEPHNGPFAEGDRIRVSCEGIKEKLSLFGSRVTLSYKNDISTRQILARNVIEKSDKLLILDEWILSSADDRNNITCSVDSSYASRIISVQYGPIIHDNEGVLTKEDIVYSGLVLGENASVIVKVKANPKPTLVRWAAGNEAIGDDDETIRKEEIDEDDGFYTYKLTIASLTKRDVLKTYRLKVTNTIGDATVYIRLQAQKIKYEEIMPSLESNTNLKILILPNTPTQENSLANCFCTCRSDSAPKLVPMKYLPAWLEPFIPRGTSAWHYS